MDVCRSVSGGEALDQVRVWMLEVEMCGGGLERKNPDQLQLTRVFESCLAAKK